MDQTVIIDGKTVILKPEDKNIVDVVSRAGIPLPAPCYRQGRGKGCCKGCIVEVDGVTRYACATKPEAGSSIVIDRADLKKKRTKNLLSYQAGIQLGVTDQTEGSGCSCDCSDDCC